VNITETSRLLTYVAAVDGRRVDDATVIAWHDILGDLQMADCQQAVRRHFAGSKDWLMPAHVRELAIKVRDDRRPKHEALSLPSRFEADEERIERVKRGIAVVVEALSESNERRAARREPSVVVDEREISRQRAIERARRERKGSRA